MRRSIWFPIVLIGMVVAFATVVIQRDRIRAHWWAWKINRTTDALEQAQLIQLLVGALPDSEPVILSLLDSDSPSVRLLAQVPIGQLSDESAVPALTGLLDDADRRVREAAGLALVFRSSDASRASLVAVAESEERVAAAAAAYSLSRDTDKSTICVLARLVSTHPSPLVRAQALESLVDRLTETAKDKRAALSENEACDPILSVVEATSDDGLFDGILAMENEIAEARDFMSTQHGPVEQPAESDEANTRRSVGEFARGLISDRFGVDIPADRQLTTVEQAEIADAIRSVIKGKSSDPLTPIPSP